MDRFENNHKLIRYNEETSDLTFIIDGDVAIPCECRNLREAEAGLKLSGGRGFW